MTTVLPTPRTPDPRQAPSLRWGVMGTGWIADRFVRSVRRHTTQQFVAVSSRDHDRARDFADRFGIPRAYGSYEDLAADPGVDVVYVATGHADHLPCARTGIEHGRHVLVEKPLGLNAGQATELAELAAARGVFCAEALWSFFLPRYDVVRQVLRDGLLGDVHTVLADCGEHFDPEHRIMRADLAGGPLLDLGTYPVSFATWVLGEPTTLLAASQPHPAGVHGQVGAVLSDGLGRQAVVHTTLFGDTPTTASISGTRGTLTLPGPFYQPGDVLFTPNGGGPALCGTEPRTAHEALFFEAAEVARCIVDGRTQTPLRPLADSIATLRTMDAVRTRCGISYPGEGE
ncbi:oxidoreductase [Actinoplanes sp. ATCC 53533]|uniref:Gfo/Idh/MocA family protein n=1 Tax=Actinoplanes sp. ATCC 53533 TaxID=1288362 RepID=UPI000F780D57|nr:Gfo/Idh/MocA family oxidoreductase [Actinoplanes sp. ATCC 53533]RSM69472.1 oxidoreductase [Actinoplanes sp. ATCC 53533]